MHPMIRLCRCGNVAERHYTLSINDKKLFTLTDKWNFGLGYVLDNARRILPDIPLAG